MLKRFTFSISLFIYLTECGKLIDTYSFIYLLVHLFTTICLHILFLIIISYCVIMFLVWPTRLGRYCFISYSVKS